jgi:hypothetical protein
MNMSIGHKPTRYVLLEKLFSLPEKTIPLLGVNILDLLVPYHLLPPAPK